ncbi:MAG TPA: choice-of-anchor J domain-containing protein [Flavobacterium sp.]|nr:choice-of-anchor J domain-containing protein [Flavobacterium sp.]
MKKITLLLAFVVCFVLPGRAQVLIGSGTDEVQHVPFEPYYGYSYAQSIYLASEISASGDITGLQWYFSGTSSLPTSQEIVIYLGHTSKTSFASNSDWEPAASLTQVYAGGISVSGPGWVTITFDTPFSYNGTDNLIVAVDENMADYDDLGDDFYCSAVAGNRSIAYYNDFTNPDPVSPPNANFDGLAAFVPNVIFDGITQSCPTPYNLMASAITSSGATLNWDLLGSETAWEVLALPASSPAPDESTSGTAVSGTPTFTFTSLTDGTVYYAYVRANCGGGLFSGWVSSGAFTTLCLPFGDLSQNFDSTATGSTPLCWTPIEVSGNTGFTNVSVVAYNVASTPNAYELYNSQFTSADIMLVSPPLADLAAGTHRMRFKAVGASGYTLSVGTMTDISDPSTYTEVQSISLGNTYASYTVDFSSGGGDFVAFRHGLAGTYQTIHIDDVVWEPIPTCADIVTSTLVYSGVTNDGATISWEAGGSETAWQYVLGMATDTDPNALTPVAVSTNPTVTLSGLDSNTAYKVWVRSDCSGDFGAWSEVLSFRTACDATGDFSESFDTTAVNTVPNCWSTVKQSTSQFVALQTVSWTSSSAPNSFELYNSGDSAATLILVSPLLNNIAAGDHRVKFKSFSYTTGATIIVGTMTDPSDPNTFTEVESISLTGTWADYNVSIPATADTYFAFKHGNGGTYRDIFVDNVVWEPIPVAPPACASDAAATPHPSCGAYATEFSWTAVPGADGYYFSLGTAAGANDIIDSQDLLSVTSFEYEGEPGMTYYFTVTPYNANGSATGCSELSYTTSAGQCFCLSAPVSNDGLGITNVQIGSTDFATPDVMYYDHSATTVDLGIGINNNVQVTFATGYTYGTRIWIDLNDDYELTEDEQVFFGTSTNANPTVFDASFVLDAGVTPGVHKARLASADSGQDANPGDPCYSGFYGVTLDFTFNLVVPACTPPAFDTADVSPDCDNNQFFIDVNVTDLGSGAPVLTDGTNNYPVTTTGTVQAGPYPNGASVTLNILHGSDVVCDIPVGTFTYACPPMNDMVCQAMELVVDVTSAGDAYTLAAATGETGEPTGSCFNAGINGSVWFTFVAPASGEVRVTTDIAGGTCEDTEIAVYAGDGADCGDMSSLGAALACSQDEGTIVNYNSFIDFAGANALTPGSTYYVQVDRWGTAPAGTFGINIVDLNPLNTGSFVEGAFVAYPNPVANEFNISYAKPITNVSVVNLLGQTVISTSPNAVSAKVDMSPLSAGTYIVKVTVDQIVKTIKVIKE